MTDWRRVWLANAWSPTSTQAKVAAEVGAGLVAALPQPWSAAAALPSESGARRQPALYHTRASRGCGRTPGVPPPAAVGIIALFKMVLPVDMPSRFHHHQRRQAW